MSASRATGPKIVLYGVACGALLTQAIRALLWLFTTAGTAPSTRTLMVGAGAVLCLAGALGTYRRAHLLLLASRSVA